MISNTWEIEKKLAEVVIFYKLDKLFCTECNKLDYELYLVGGFIRNLIFENKIDAFYANVKYDSKIGLII